MFTARYGLDLYIQLRLFLVFNALPLFMHSVAGLPPQKTLFNPRPVHIFFVVDNLFLGHWNIFRPGASLSPVSIIPPMFHTHLFLHVTFTRRTTGQSLGAG